MARKRPSNSASSIKNISASIWSTHALTSWRRSTARADFTSSDGRTSRRACGRRSRWTAPASSRSRSPNTFRRQRRRPEARGGVKRARGEGVPTPQEGVTMQRSEERILTTHVGSLPRHPKLRDLLVRQDRGEVIDGAELECEVEAAVRHVVQKQLEVGIDIGNDGEQPRVGFSTYVGRRMRGFGGESRRPPARDMVDFPDYAAMLEWRRRAAGRINNAPQAMADVQYTGLNEAAKECDLFRRVID